VPGRALTLHGVDRLTGMPVLLHRLNEFVVPAHLPESASLLPVYEVDVWDGQPYAITELPLSATPATHPGAAALGALRALSALHAAGQVHGNVNASQLWQVGREVRLAGAGLPWSKEGSPAADLAALGQALDSLGARPAALDGLETQSAAQALKTLEEALRGQRPAEAASARPASLPGAPEPVGPAVQAERSPVKQPRPEATATVNPPVASPDQPEAPATPEPAGQTQAPGPQPPVQQNQSPSPKAARKQEARKAVPPGTDTAVEAASAGVTQVQPTPASAPPSPPQAAPTPVSYRSAQDIIVIGVPQTPDLEMPGEPQGNVATLGTGEPNPASPASPPVRLIPAPIRIGFDDMPPLPSDWTPPDVSAAPQPEAAAPGVQPAFTAPVAPLERSGEPVAQQASVNSVRSQPLRIGWEEDHSWRVVKSGPERRRLEVPALTGRSLPRSLVMALAALVVLGGAAFWWRGQTATSAGSCCSQTFTVSGSRQPVKVTLVKAPPGSPLTPGGVVGTAPGTLKFPDTPGSYTLKFEAAGHGALTGTVTVPSAQAFDIVLK